MMIISWSPDIPEIVMKGQVPQEEGFHTEVDGTETEGITTLGFTTLITLGIEMSSETLISAAGWGEEKISLRINRAVACFLCFSQPECAPCLVELCLRCSASPAAGERLAGVHSAHTAHCTQHIGHRAHIEHRARTTHTAYRAYRTE